MKALIFGITGQDGSYLAEYLLDQGYEVMGVVRRSSTPSYDNVEHIVKKVELLEGDITDAFSVSNIINSSRPDEVYNLAAQSHVGTSFDQPSLTWDVVAGGPLNILEAIRFSPRKDKIKFYQASSSEMFGHSYDIGRDGRKYQDENTSFMPQSPYAIAKLAAHHLVRVYRSSYGVFGCSGILFNHESERRGEHFVTRKITKWIGQFKNWLDVVGGLDGFNENYICGFRHPDAEHTFPKLRLGNLDALRDWGHAHDYVRAMHLMLQQDVADDYVVATGETHTVRDFLTHAFIYIDIDNWAPYVVIDPKFYRPCEVDFLLGHANKARSKLGWKPEVSFEELAKRMVEHDTRLQRSNLQKI